LVGPLVGGRSQEDQSRRTILDIAGTYLIKLGSRRTRFHPDLEPQPRPSVPTVSVMTSFS
jgi:hypothetical protein